MIQNYVNKLIDNMPCEIKNKDKPLHLDLVLGGGAFNGSYLIGALYFLKEMEKKGFIVVERISGCSIGSIAGLFYLIDQLNDMNSLYKIVVKKFKKNFDLSILKDLQDILKNTIPNDMSSIVNKKLYISYNNVNTCHKIVKCKYKNNDDIFETILKSSFIPILTDGNFTYKNKYIDGITPHFFKTNTNGSNKKVLFLDLFTLDKLYFVLNIKNEKTNYHRILSGLLDIHFFFIKQRSTQMCSYVNEWNLGEKSFQNFKYIIEKIIIYLICLTLFIKNAIFFKVDSILSFKDYQTIIKKITMSFLNKYCF
jgi:hypothetical protein